MDKMIGNIGVYTDKNGNLIMKSDNSIFCSSFYFQDYYDDKLINKFIKSTEAIIRQSREYNDYLSLLKTNYNILNFDNLQSHISDGDASIEIHHYPFTLYDIVDTVMTYHIIQKDKFTSFSLAKEIMDLHFQHKIGFVPLTITNHQLAHDEAIFISLKQVFGDWKAFYKQYESGVSEAMKTKIAQLESLTDAGLASDFRRLY